LRITEKRKDGFHNIETLFCPLPLCDALEFVESDDQKKGDNLTITGIETGGKKEDNLILKAVGKLRESYRFPFLNMHLHKAIPVGAGLGGGSSDAAFILKGINRYYGLNLNNETLKEIALELGSDCPFFIDCTPSFATGRGEIMVPCEKNVLKNHYLILLNPGIGVNTREAYQNCLPSIPSEALSSVIENLPPEQWKGKVVNDFEEYVFSRHPVIGKIKEELYQSGAIFSLMSGSGSSVYGIFRTKKKIPDRLKDFVIWQGLL
jgi:4-diphosphocytidyl-2-C-methyl-D-erythritol kinase